MDLVISKNVYTLNKYNWKNGSSFKTNLKIDALKSLVKKKMERKGIPSGI